MAYIRNSNRRRRGNNSNNRRNNNKTPRINHVYDSNGPEGKVRGTAPQIVEKYISRAHDVSTNDDKSMMHAFYQHAEHYQRIINDINAEKEVERKAQEQAKEQEQQAKQTKARQQSSQETGSEQKPNKKDQDNNLPDFITSRSKDDKPKKAAKPAKKSVKSAKKQPADQELETV